MCTTAVTILDFHLMIIMAYKIHDNDIYLKFELKKASVHLKRCLLQFLYFFWQMRCTHNINVRGGEGICYHSCTKA